MDENNDYDDRIQLSDLSAVAKYNYRTLGLCKALKIKRERFRDWVKAGYIKPTLPAIGQGSKAGFTIGDLYATALFKKMTDTGFKRELSADIVSKFSGVVSGNPIEFIQYLVCILRTNPENGEQDIKVIMTFSGDGRDTLDLNINSKTMKFDVPTDTDGLGWEGMFMFNIVQLRQSVDLALSNAGL